MNASLAVAALAALALSACSPETPPAAAAAPSAPVTSVAAVAASPGTAPYDFGAPVARFTLPDELREISGLTVLDADHLGAVQDEQGSLYVLETETGRVTSVVPFGPPGDYEGVEMAGERLFVLRADGALLELAGWAGGDTRTVTFETGLGADACDAEGLAYDARGNRLLISCKEDGTGAFDGRVVVRAFDLARNALVGAPALVVDPAAVPGSKKLALSALAVHPLSGHVVAVSSRRDALVALDAQGAVLDTWSLVPAALEQPEGLAFLPTGDVLVASEGGDGAGVVLRFAYTP